MGHSWSMLFVSVGYQVMLYGILPEELQKVIKETE